MEQAKPDSFITRIAIRDDKGNVVAETEAISFRGLLHLAHEDGLKSVGTELLQAPRDDNGWTAIVRAVVRTRKGSFSGIGDANTTNVHPKIAGHFVRMAETRAIARAFRLALNVGTVAVEELSEDSRESRHHDHNLAPLKRARTPVRPMNSPQRNAHDAGPRMSEAQRQLLFRLATDLGETRVSAPRLVLSALKVERLEHATRVAATRAIDQLKADINQQRTTVQTRKAHSG